MRFLLQLGHGDALRAAVGRGFLGVRLLLVPKERNTHTSLSTCSDEGHQGRRKVKSCQQSQVKSRVR